ncbi:MAG TPA: S8 family serine peptidase, partial [Chthoniobacteraceae bacterium]|nr:S8 family serine peptidase [Chthoniobacteraceae bacterium]
MNPWITPEEAWAAIQRGRGKGVRIAVLDSGIEADHPDLGGLELVDDIAVVEDGMKLKVVPGGGRDLFGHGTAVAGILRAAAPEAEIGSIRVLGESLSARTAIILEGARQAIERGYHILNCSLGCGVPEHVLKYKSWVDEAYLKGVHVVAACNNQDSGRPEWPGFFTSVITVNMARTEENGHVFYKPGHLVEFAARGVDVDVPWSGGGTKKVTGSSFAAPRVAGMLACLLSEVPRIPPLQAKAL